MGNKITKLCIIMVFITTVSSLIFLFSFNLPLLFVSISYSYIFMFLEELNSLIIKNENN